MGRILSKLKKIKKVQTYDSLVLPDYEEIKPKPLNNIFVKPLGDTYAKLLFDVYNSNIEDRDNKIIEVYQKATKDKELTAYQSRLIKRIFFLYTNAIGMKNNMMVPLISYAKAHRNHIKKNCSEVRLRREIQNLETVANLFGVDYDINTLGFKIVQILHVYTIFNKTDRETLDRISIHFISTISSFSKKLNRSFIDYIWFVMMVLKNLDSIMNANIDMLRENETVKQEINKYIQSIILIDKIIEDNSHSDNTNEREMNNNELQLQSSSSET